MESSDQGQVVKLKNQFLNTWPLAPNLSERCAVKYKRRREGIGTATAVNNGPATVATAKKREEKSPVAIGNDPTNVKRERFEKEMPPGYHGRLPTKDKMPQMADGRLLRNME